MKTIICFLIALSLSAQVRPPAGGQIQGVSGGGNIAVTSKGAQTPGACVVIDADGNHVAGSCSSGPAGATGAQGIQGIQGIQGVAGPTGAAGTNGTNGTNGAAGATGATGAAGSNGSNGSAGATGATGAAGVSTLASGTSHTFSGTSDVYVCTGTCALTVPVPVAGVQYCAINGDNVATVMTFAAIGSSARYENTARTAYGTAGTGTFVAGGAVKDFACIMGLDSTHYLTTSSNGTWTAN